MLLGIVARLWIGELQVRYSTYCVLLVLHVLEFRLLISSFFFRFVMNLIFFDFESR